MAYFAELDPNNVVLRVVSISNEVIKNTDLTKPLQKEEEWKGINYCKSLFGGFDWKQTSYNKTIRKNFASVGFTYDSEKDAFIPPKPFNSWLLNEETCEWKPPIPLPLDDKMYYWDEENQQWVEHG